MAPISSSLLETTVALADGCSISLRATLYPPQDMSFASGVVFFCLPGGGMTRRYFDLGTSDQVDYSFVRHMSERGHTLICLDHIGVGDNPLPHGADHQTPRRTVPAIAAAIAEWRSAPALSHTACAIGLGHSMGGFYTALMQGMSGPFDGVVLLGAHAGGLDWGLTDDERAYIDRQDDLEPVLMEMALAKFSAPLFDQPGPSETSKRFGGETPGATSLLRQAIAPVLASGAMMSMIKGSMRKEVEAITAPIFFAFGDNDLGQAPHLAPRDFVGSSDIRLIVLPETGHNSFAFRTIGMLCDRLDAWAREQARLSIEI